MELKLKCSFFTLNWLSNRTHFSHYLHVLYPDQNGKLIWNFLQCHHSFEEQLTSEDSEHQRIGNIAK